MTDTIRWGVLGTGNIARKFARGLSVLDDAELLAVGSRAQDTADVFGDEFDVSHRYDSYAALADDADVDVIYISTPHPFHKENTLLCLNAGRAVLCEKPFAMNVAEVEAMVACAREKKIFLMEAMWTHFFPAITKVRNLLADGAIGDLRMVKADFGYVCNLGPEHRSLNLELGGGGLLDVGVYTIALAQMVYGGEPERIASMVEIGETGVDDQAAMILGYPGGAMAILACAVRTSTVMDAIIIGTKGKLRIGPNFWQPDEVTLSMGGRDETFSFKRLGNGYGYQAQDVMKCLREGKLESDIMPHEKSLAVMRTMDKLRADWGLRYPME